MPPDKTFETEFKKNGLPYFSVAYQKKSITPQLTVVAAITSFFELLLPALITENSPIFSTFMAVTVFLAGFAALNLLRFRHPLTRPQRPGIFEALWFIIVPAATPTIIAGRWGVSLSIIVFNTLVLAAVYASKKFAVLPVASWTLRHLKTKLAQTFSTLTKALPFVFLVVFLVFYTANPWQLAAAVPLSLLAFVVALIALFALSLLTVSSRKHIYDTTKTAIALNRDEKRNCKMLLVVSEATIIAIVCAATFIMLISLGSLTVPLDLLESWGVTDPETLFSFQVASTNLAVTTELAKVSLLLTSFAGLQFTVTLLSGTADSAFLLSVREHLQDCLRQRERYWETMPQKTAPCR